MSGVMSFGGASDKHRMWFCAGWGFSGFLDHMIECYQGDDEFVRILEVAKYHNGLHLELEEEKLPGLKPRILGAILNVAQEVVDGKHRVKVEGRELSESDQLAYRVAVAELLELAKREVGRLD